VFCYISRLSLKQSHSKTTAQLYPGRDTFEFEQGHVTKNQPITELIFPREEAEGNIEGLKTKLTVSMWASH